MTFLAQISGHFDHPNADDAKAAETRVAEQLRSVAQGLTDAGAVGVNAGLTGEHIGQVNLLAEPEPEPETAGDALGGHTPQPPAEGETQPLGTAVPDGTPAPLDPAAAGAGDAPDATGTTPGYTTPPQG